MKTTPEQAREAALACDSLDMCGTGDMIRSLAAQVAALTADRDESDAIRDKLALLLAGVAIALKGPELPLHRHGYHDLAKCAQVAMLEIELLKHMKSQVEAERDAYRADAERYRWLRARLPGRAYRIAGVIYSEGGAGVDAGIDAARKEAP